MFINILLSVLNISSYVCISSSIFFIGLAIGNISLSGVLTRRFNTLIPMIVEQRQENEVYYNIRNLLIDIDNETHEFVNDCKIIIIHSFKYYILLNISIFIINKYTLY
jgi:hypothetical protein